MVTCPNCGRRNSAENAYCANCGFRLPTAAARGTGVAYRRAEQAEPHGGGGQGLLAFGAVLLAGLLFAVGAVALLLSPPAGASQTPIAVGAIDPTSSLPIFVQETPTPAPLPSVTPLPSFALFTATPPISFVPPSFPSSPPFSATPPPTPPPATPTPTVPHTPRPTPTPTPVSTPPNCSGANGSDMRTVIIGYGNAQSVGPLDRAWCIHRVVIRPFIEGGDTSSTGLPGETRLKENGHSITSDTCAADECNDKTKQFSPPHLTPSGSTLTYEFKCIDNPGTPDVDECTVAGGSTIEIDYEVVRGT